MAQDVPLNAPVDICAWMAYRRELLEAWRVSFGIFQSGFLGVKSTIVMMLISPSKGGGNHGGVEIDVTF
jgi:hypothetical protein